jgi:hypothetical protein
VDIWDDLFDNEGAGTFRYLAKYFLQYGVMFIVVMYTLQHLKATKNLQFKILELENRESQ